MKRNSNDRYKLFRRNGDVTSLPFVNIKERSSDKFVKYQGENNRLDIVSNRFYGTPLLNWLILMANPQYGGMEFDIPTGSVLRIPYPLQEAMEEYNEKQKTKLVR